MIQSLQLRTDPATAASELRLIGLASTKLNVDANRIAGIVITRRSIDARQRNVAVELTLNVFLDEKPESLSLCKPEKFERLPDNAPQANCCWYRACRAVLPR